MTAASRATDQARRVRWVVVLVVLVGLILAAAGTFALRHFSEPLYADSLGVSSGSSPEAAVLHIPRCLGPVESLEVWNSTTDATWRIVAEGPPSVMEEIVVGEQPSHYREEGEWTPGPAIAIARTPGR